MTVLPMDNAGGHSFRTYTCSSFGRRRLPSKDKVWLPSRAPPPVANPTGESVRRTHAAALWLRACLPSSSACIPNPGNLILRCSNRHGRDEGSNGGCCLRLRLRLGLSFRVGLCCPEGPRRWTRILIGVIVQEVTLCCLARSKRVKHARRPGLLLHGHLPSASRLL